MICQILTPLCRESQTRLTLDFSNNLVNVFLIVGRSTVSNAELSVGGFGSTVTVRKIVNDDLDDLLLASAVLDLLSVREIGTEIRDFGDGVEPGESGNLRD